jgi:hypothetical protein
MMKEKDGIPAKATAYGVNFKPHREPDLEFDKTWVQERTNQLAMLDTFFSVIQPEESLVFCYAKQTPLTEDVRIQGRSLFCRAGCFEERRASRHRSSALAL